MASNTQKSPPFQRFDEEHPFPPPPRGPWRRWWRQLGGVHPYEAIANMGLTPSKLGLRPPMFSLRHYAPKPLRLPGHYARGKQSIGSPTISIVTPSYNQSVYLSRTIESILSQNYDGLDYIVRDGASTDGSQDVLAGFGDSVNWRSAPDGGQADAINRGFANSRGEVMAWLNSDDLLLPGALAFVGEYFERNPDVDVVYGHRILIDENDREIGRWILPPHQDHSLRWVDTIPQETMFWRRGLWERVGGLNADLAYAMDWDLILRFLEAGARFERLPRFLGAFRVHEQQKTTSQAKEVGRPEIRSLRERTFGYVPSKPLIARQISGYLARHLLLHTGYRLGLIRY